MNKKNTFNEDLEYYLLREIALRSEFTQFELAKKTYNPQRDKGKKTITFNFIKRKMKEYTRLEKEIEKARQEIEEEVA